MGRLRLDPLALVGIGALIGLWYLCASSLGPLRLPNPTVVWEAFKENLTGSALMEAQGLGGGGILGQLGVTIFRTILGVSIGGFAGIVIGVTMANIRKLDLFLRPPLEILRLTPSLVAVPFLVLWFGTSSIGQISLVVFYSLVTMQLSAYSAVTNLPPWTANFARSLGATRRRVMWTVTLPAILPELVGAILVVLQLGWGLELVAEIVGAQRGIGRMMSSMQSLFRTELVIAGLLLIALVAVIADKIIRALMYRVTRWAE